MELSDVTDGEGSLLFRVGIKLNAKSTWPHPNLPFNLLRTFLPFLRLSSALPFSSDILHLSSVSVATLISGIKWAQ